MTEIVQQAGGRTVTSTRVGVVTGKSADKTVRVDINVLVKHAKYGKYLRRRTRLAVHDEANQAREGDVVEIASCRRLSKTKSWRLVKVIRHGVSAHTAESIVDKRPAAEPDKG